MDQEPGLERVWKESGLSTEDVLSGYRAVPRFLHSNPRAFQLLLNPDDVGSIKDTENIMKRLLPLEIKINLVLWLKEALKLGIIWMTMPKEYRVSSFDGYRKGYLYSFDISSACAVHALDVEPEDNVLELCCAPCMKMSYIHDIQYSKLRLRKKEFETFRINNLNNKEKIEDMDFKLAFKPKISYSERVDLGMITGIDIDRNRLAIGNSILKKYHINNYKLYLQDALTPLNDKNVFYIPSIMKNILKQGKPNEKNVYNKVLIDAECTHDGSISHIIKKQNMNWDDRKFLNPTNNNKNEIKENLLKLELLQRNLISKGFELLEPGGYLVYSTCSFSYKQNELIILWLLNKYKDKCKLINLQQIFEHWPFERNFKTQLLNSEYDLDWKNGDFENLSNDQLLKSLSKIIDSTLRLNPISSGTSGMFICKIKKDI